MVAEASRQHIDLSVADGSVPDVSSIMQLVALRLIATLASLRRMAGFAGVGLTGVVVNTAALGLLTGRRYGLHYLVASALATQVAIMWNFALVDLLVFRHARRGRATLRFGRFWVLNIALLPLQLFGLAALVSGVGMPVVMANVVVLSVIFGLRYVVSGSWIYRLGTLPGAPGETPHEVPAQRQHGLAGGPSARPVRRRRAVQLGLRLLLPAAVTLVAFPNLLGSVTRLRGSSRELAVLAVAVAVVLAILSTRPGREEPNVHDRQLDGILGVPLLGMALWLSWTWWTQTGLAAPLTDHEALAVVALLAGASVLLLGTRATARLRWSLLALLALAPALTARPFADAVLLAVVVVAGLTPVVHSLWSQRVRGQAAVPRTQGHLAHGWPTGWVVPVLVLLLALVMGLHQGNAKIFGRSTRVASVHSGVAKALTADLSTRSRGAQ